MDLRDFSAKSMHSFIMPVAFSCAFDIVPTIRTDSVIRPATKIYFVTKSRLSVPIVRPEPLKKTSHCYPNDFIKELERNANFCRI